MDWLMRSHRSWRPRRMFLVLVLVLVLVSVLHIWYGDVQLFLLKHRKQQHQQQQQHNPSVLQQRTSSSGSGLVINEPAVRNQGAPQPPQPPAPHGADPMPRAVRTNTLEQRQFISLSEPLSEPNRIPTRPPGSDVIINSDVIPTYFHLLNTDHAKIAARTGCNLVPFSPYLLDKRLVMCAYSRAEDRWISGMLEEAGRWEPDLMDAMERLFSQDPTLNLIDIGANIGVFSLLGAMWGRKVVAVEPNPENANKLVSTLSMNNLTDHVTVLQNAVSDHHHQIEMVVDTANRGGSVVISDRASNSSRNGIPESQRQFLHNIDTIYMDELLRITRFKRAILKIDIEGFEAIAFRKSRDLLKKLDICYIFMEWDWIREEKKGGDVFIYNLLVEFGYLPYNQPTFADPPLTDITQLVDQNMFWKRKKC